MKKLAVIDQHIRLIPGTLSGTDALRRVFGSGLWHYTDALSGEIPPRLPGETHIAIKPRQPCCMPDNRQVTAKGRHIWRGLHWHPADRETRTQIRTHLPRNGGAR